MIYSDQASQYIKSSQFICLFGGMFLGGNVSHEMKSKISVKSIKKISKT